MNERRFEHTHGFTMVELLVVAVIVAVLAALAVPIFLNQRNKAYGASEKSDVQNLQQAISKLTSETSGTGFPSFGAALKTALEDNGFRIGSGNAIDLYPDCSMPSGTPVYPSAGNYVIRGFRNAGPDWPSFPYFVYDSSTNNWNVSGFNTIYSSVCSPSVTSWRG